jgi:hypothetical protein
MEVSVAHCAQIIQDIVATIIPQTTRGTTGIPIQIDPLIREETHNITPRMHLVAGTTVQS